jgi:tRNA (guanine-N7-)-methyltransferase
MDDHRPLRTFGRTRARALKPRQAALVETLLPRLALDLADVIEIEALFAHAALETPPGAPRAPTGSRGSGEVVLEIGFGGGEHLAAQASSQPCARFIGVEPFLNGVASCLRHIEESGATNVRLHHGDARAVMARLPDASLDVCYILFPDPWPKLRHHKRRLIQPELLSVLARVLKPGAEVRFATDWANYAAWTLEHFNRDRRFSWMAGRAGDWRAPWSGHTQTRYEQKRLGDCAPIWLRFQRLFP